MQITDLVYIDAAGYHYADYPSFLSWIQGQYQSIYGADVYLGPDSQDGQFLAALALAFYQTAAIGASTYNSLSPVTAQGLGLARNVKINGLTKRIATNSTVDLTIIGQAGTTIANGIAVDSLNQQWLLPATVTIPGGGTITVTSTAANVGNVSADANTITTIFTPTLGWQSVNNALAAIEGAPIETDAQLRVRQAQSTANPSLTVFDGTIGAVANVTGVTAVRGYENQTGNTDGNGITPHSICIVAAGGDDMAVAQAIQVHKTPGGNTYASGTGSVQETVYDTHGMPVIINFFRPIAATISVQIAITPGVGWSTDFETQIAAAVTEAINNVEIGAIVFLTPLYLKAYLPGPAGQTYTISAIQLKKNSGSFAAANVSLNFTERPICGPVTFV